MGERADSKALLQTPAEPLHASFAELVQLQNVLTGQGLKAHLTERDLSAMLARACSDRATAKRVHQELKNACRALGVLVGLTLPDMNSMRFRLYSLAEDLAAVVCVPTHRRRPVCLARAVVRLHLNTQGFIVHPGLVTIAVDPYNQPIEE